MIKDAVINVFHKLGYRVSRIATEQHRLFAGSNEFVQIREKCRKYTMVSDEAMRALYDAVHYIQDQCVSGDLVECGVWRGGCSMLMVHTLEGIGESDRHIYMYDTFSGMSSPTDIDIKISDGHSPTNGTEKWNRLNRQNYTDWQYCPYDEVRDNMISTNYPPNRIHLIKGKVEDSIPVTSPSSIALLRLDTDFYESTLHELRYLFPLLEAGGVLIIDDYDSWAGSRNAVDEYFLENNINMLLSRISGGGRIGVKV